MGVQIKDFIMIKGHNKNFSNTFPNQVINIPVLATTEKIFLNGSI
jgi:hypothetical protein